MDIGFVALENFIPTQEYIDWSRLYHVKEIISLDCALCPSIINQLYEEDNKYLLQYEWYSDIFNDLEWLSSKAKGIMDKQILAVVMEPEQECANINFDARFKFYGYDLVEDYTGISALTNCGGFDEAFSPNELSPYGLIENYNEAKRIQQLLMEKYPYEDHAYCSLWAIWRMENNK